MPRATAIRTIYSNDEVLVVYKPASIPSAPLTEDGDEFCLVNLVKDFEPRVMVPIGRLRREGGLVHRLDTPTRGLVLFALTQKAYDDLMVQQKKDGIVKQYRATPSWGRCPLPEGFPDYPYHDVLSEAGAISSCFRSYGPKGASVRPTLDAQARRCSGVVYSTLTEPDGDGSVICTLTRGFRHQIRAHLAWSGHPLQGDERYGGRQADVFGLEAVGLSFRDPESGNYLTITV